MDKTASHSTNLPQHSQNDHMSDHVNPPYFIEDVKVNFKEDEKDPRTTPRKKAIIFEKHLEM